MKNSIYLSGTELLLRVLAYRYRIFILFFSFAACGETDISSAQHSDYKPHSNFIIKECLYDSVTIPQFFRGIISCHLVDFYQIDSLKFNKFFSHNKISKSDSANIETYYTIEILHALFTSKNASNFSRGEILNIPYMWHWVNPNPRHDIYFSNTKQKLSERKPPVEFSKYGSWADIDRTPYLFLSDLVTPNMKYYSSICGEFATFGWCSEREMAFVALHSLLDIEGKVVAEGNHSWSEFLIPFRLNTGKTQRFRVKVDNTFDDVQWHLIDENEISKWRKYYGNTALSEWYNKKAKSFSELNRIKNHIVPASASSRMERGVVTFLQNRISER